MIDGDNRGVGARLNEIDTACRNSSVPGRAHNERVAVFIPTWNIQTWLAYLDGDEVDEGRPNYPRLARERECQPHVPLGTFENRRPRKLTAACHEYRTRLLGQTR